MEWILILGILASTNNPYKLTRPAKLKQVKSIIKYAEAHDQDSYELLAIAITESALKPRVVSRAGAIGLFQVMCKYWYKPLRYKTINQCNKALFKPKANIKAGVHVLTTFRKNYKQCQGDFAYRCYYAGAGWPQKRGRLGQKIKRYEKKVRTTRDNLHKYYEDLIEHIRTQVKTRS